MQQTVTCANCGSEGSASQRFCTNCGATLPEAAATQVVTPQQQEQPWSIQPGPGAEVTPVERIAVPPRKYVLLGATAIIFRIIGWVVLVGGILGSIAIAVLASQGAMPGLVNLLDTSMATVGVSGIAGAGLAVFVLVGIINSLLLGLGLLAFSELSSAVMAIDENTRSQR